jgi:nitroreductase
MDVQNAIAARRAYRSLAPVDVTDELIHDLARNAGLSPSCDNNQPWRFIFVRDPAALSALHEALTRGNAWMKAASALIVVCGRADEDCIIRDREYVLFDLGLASAFLILRATELGLVAHPVAGFSPKKTREVLGIPEAYKVITVIALGRKAESISPVLNPDQVLEETERPARIPFERFVFIDRFPAVDPAPGNPV